MKRLAHYGTIVPKCQSVPRPPTRLLAIGLVIVLAMALVACSASPPEEAPAIRGEILAAELDANGLGVIHVEGEIADGTTYDRASVSVTDKTRVFATDGSKANGTALGVGDQVEIWFTGPVAESYPVQATAGDIQILGSTEP